MFAFISEINKNTNEVGSLPSDIFDAISILLRVAIFRHFDWSRHQQ